MKVARTKIWKFSRRYTHAIVAYFFTSLPNEWEKLNYLVIMWFLDKGWLGRTNPWYFWYRSSATHAQPMNTSCIGLMLFFYFYIFFSVFIFEWEILRCAYAIYVFFSSAVKAVVQSDYCMKADKRKIRSGEITNKVNGSINMETDII